MKSRVTQTDIARIAGVHNTTVSLALRNSRSIPDATRKRIQEIAAHMGYCPDPALRALVAYRNSQRQKRPTETLAYVTNWPTKWGWQQLPSQQKFYDGAQRKAAESGYRLEHLWLGETGMTQRRLDSMLLHRGIRGVLLASHRATCDELSEIDWSRLCAVRIGCFPHSPAFHQLTDDQRGTVSLAMNRVRQAGYQRVGLILNRRRDESVDHAWSKAFFAEQCFAPHRDRLPILYLQSPAVDAASPTEVHTNDMRALLQWYYLNRPDVIMGLEPGVLACIREAGWSIPGEVPFVNLDLENPDSSVAGVKQNYERVGELAVEMLAGYLQQNQVGVPEAPTVTSVSASWFAGASLPMAQTVGTATAETYRTLRAKSDLGESTWSPAGLPARSA